MTNVSSLFLSDHLPVISIGGLVCVKLFGGEGGKLGNEATYVSAISTTNERFSIDETVQCYLGLGGGL